MAPETTLGRAALDPSPSPSESQRKAIEAPLGPTLVLAGPGAGKTFCLIERIRHLIERGGIPPERICAFTFTNKAAGEIAHRLERQLGQRADHVRRGTIHAFCAELLREFGERVDLPAGFGIADEEYQVAMLRRAGVPMKLQRSVLGAITLFRLRGQPMSDRYAAYYEAYRTQLKKQNVVDFDSLLLEARRLLGYPDVAAQVRSRWSAILVDEFQDLSPVQYAIVKALAGEHGHVFAVGDDEQSIFSWAGADPEVFITFANDFEIARAVHLGENRRCPRNIFERARELVQRNPSLFEDRLPPEPKEDSPFGVSALGFRGEEDELAWLLTDVQRDRAEHSLPWGEYAVLYRRHGIGNALEAAFVGAGVPCRLAQGRAISEDPVASYVIAALRVIHAPDDELARERFLEVVLPRGLVKDAATKAEEQGRTLIAQLLEMANRLPREHPDARKLWRARYELENLAALGSRHTSLALLVEELLSHRVGAYRSMLEDRHDDISDPAAHEEVVRLAERIETALASDQPGWLPRMGGAEIPLRMMLTELGFRTVHVGGEPPPGSARFTAGDAPTLGLPLALFKAGQFMRSRGFANAFQDFTAFDLETTGNHVESDEIVEIAAVRVRNGTVVGEFHSLVRPRVPIHPKAVDTHGITESDVANAPTFEEVWPAFRDFAGSDLLVAHNGYLFDFPILRRMASALPGWKEPLTYDTLPLARDLHATSRRQEHLAALYGIETGKAHRALDDTRTLAAVFVKLHETKIERARKTSLVNLLDVLGLALALWQETEPGEEATLFRERITRVFTLGRHSDVLERYRAERELAGDRTLPTVEQVIERLGGTKVMQRIRAQKTAADRYPAAMARLRRLISLCGGDTLAEQTRAFLESVALSAKGDGVVADAERVNLLTLHSTKGLEFSRVYIVGVEDSELPGESQDRGRTQKEVEEARRLLYVGMTRAKDRLVLTRVEAREGKPTGGYRFMAEMGLAPE